jgi:exopolysaccharide production protein ExoZ
VDIFFVISGFIMFYTSCRDFGKPGAVKKFLLRRLIRIVPIYWLLTGVEVVIELVRGLQDVDPIHIVKSLFFIPFIAGNGKFRPVLGQGWSLNYEMLFYCVFALALLLPRRVGIPAIFIVFSLLIAAGNLFQFDEALLGWTRPVITEFLLGVVLGIAFVERPEWFGRLKVAALPLVLILIVALFWLWEPPGIMQSSLMFRPVYWGVAMLIVATALICRDTQGANPISRMMTRIGDSSYSLYLTHPIAGLVLARMLIKLGIARFIPIPIYFIGSLILLILFGWVFHMLFEVPMTRYLSSRLVKRSPEHPILVG